MENEKGIITFCKERIYTGWHGNVLFQTAATIGIATKNGMDYCFPISDWTKNYFNAFVEGGIPQNAEVASLPTTDFTELNYHYDPVIFEDKTKNYNLLGYYQTKKYWSHCEDLIRKIFTFNDATKKYIEEKYSTLLQPKADDSYLISIHVRRGDYLNNPNHHPVMSVQYYIDGAERIISMLRENQKSKVKFVVCSDGIDWCKENFSDLEIFKDRIIFAEGNDQPQDMYLMTVCNSFIISNSTMSWWGSFLSNHKNKIIIAPTKDKWYGEAYKDWSLDDLYCDEWILI